MKTMKPRIVAYKPLPDDVLVYLREHAEVIRADGADALADALGEADGAIGASLKITPQMLDRAPRLKAWSTISVGYDNFDVADLTRRGIVLAHTPDVLTESTADTVFSLILASARRVVELAEWVKAGHWQRSIGPELYGTDVQGKTLGIVGLGRIGGAVATPRRARLPDAGAVHQPFGARRSGTAVRRAARHARRTARAGGFRVPAGAAVAADASSDRRGRIREDEARCDPDQRVARPGGRRGRADRRAARGYDPRRGARRVREGAVVGRLAAAADEQRRRAAAYRLGDARDASCDGALRGENLVGALAGTLRTNLVNPDALAHA
jgi:gluconate 2-dehydrogenase